MSYRGSVLSEIEPRYPFAPKSRRFFETIPVGEGLTSRDVVQQAEVRLMNAIGRSAYEPHISELTEFSSFFAAAFVASQDDYLVSKFSKKEAERTREFFALEKGNSKVAVMAECFGTTLELVGSDGSQASYSLPFENYLALVSKYELSRQPKWKLARQALESGTVFVSDNLFNDLFGDCAQKAVADGARNLRKAPFPKQLSEVKAALAKYIPVGKSDRGKRYAYVDYLLGHPVADGRHRLTWLVLAPFLVNVKKLPDDEAIEKIRGFVAAGGESAGMRRFVEYNVRRARRNGLLPPTISTLRNEHPDLYSLLPKEALAMEASTKQKQAK